MKRKNALTTEHLPKLKYQVAGYPGPACNLTFETSGHRQTWQPSKHTLYVHSANNMGWR